MDSLHPASPAQAVRTVERADVLPLSRSLARAFADDPVSAYLFPGKRREQKLDRYFRFQLRSAFLQKGECYTTEDRRSAALWLPPKGRTGHISDQQNGRSADRPAASDVLSQIPGIFVLGFSLGRAVRLVQLLERHHPKHPHYYLATIGTAPEAQSRGLGAAVMAPVLARCDAESIPAYLESSSERAVRFYARLGFEEKGRVVIPGTNVRLWLMWRQSAGRARERGVSGPEAQG